MGLFRDLFRRSSNTSSKVESDVAPKTKDIRQDEGLRIISRVIVFGALTIVLISVWIPLAGKKAFWPVLGLSFTFSLASLLCGGFLGFLFGIPRSLQRNVTEGADTLPGQGRLRPYSNNTNLEQISDWLTKIIVGVSLTQLPAIERNFQRLASSIANGFSGLLPTTFAYPYAAALLVFYAICGFLAVYLWAKIYLLKQLTSLDRDLDGALLETNKKIDEVDEKQNIKLEIAKLESQLNDFNRQKNKLRTAESKPDIKPIVDIAAPENINYVDDGQKGRWGNTPVANGYRLEASFNKRDPLDDVYDIVLTVRAEAPGTELTGLVYFFLHDSYYPDCVLQATAKNNAASQTIVSFEAFTVGAVCNGGAVKLELDLNTYDKSPEDYRYSGPLYTYEELKTKLDKLKAELPAPK